MENGKKKKAIKTYDDLEVYQRLFDVMEIVMKQIIPKLPVEEKFDLVDQLRRSCKAPLALLAEGFAKRYQVRAWKKYLDDAIGECNETINHLTVCLRIYGNHVDKQLCQQAIDEYNIANRQLYQLKKSWKNFHDKI